MKERLNLTVLRHVAIFALACTTFLSASESSAIHEKLVSSQRSAMQQLPMLEVALVGAFQVPVDPASPTPANSAVLLVVNESDKTICHVSVSLPAQPQKYDNYVDRLAGGRIDPHESYQIDLAPGLYGVHLTDCLGNILLHQEYLTVVTLYELHLTDSDIRASACGVQNFEGIRLYSSGQSGKALKQFTSALDCYRGLGNRYGEGGTLNNIAAVYALQGRLIEALYLFRQAESIAREMHDQTAVSAALNGEAGVYQDQGQYDEALQAYQAALVIRREMLDLSGVATILNNMGIIYRRQEHYDEALRVFRETLETHRHLGDSASLLVVLNNIAEVYRAQGQYAQALDTYGQALAMARDIGDRASELAILHNRGLAYEKSKEIASAITDYRAAAALAEQLLTSATLDTAIASMTNQQISISAPSRRLAIVLAQSGNLREALTAAERGKAILLRTELTNRPVDFRAGLDQALLDRETELRRALGEAQRLVDALAKAANVSSADKQKAEASLAEARKAYAQHLETMQLSGGYLARQLAFEAAPPDKIQAALPADATLLLYVISGVKGAPNGAFLVTRTTIDFVVLDVDETALGEQVTAFTANRRAPEAALSALYRTVFAPLASKVSTQRLIIVPDGTLNYVPFAALEAPDGRYLIDQYTISLLPSATALVLLKDRKATASATSEGLVLAQRAAPGLPDLRFVRTEAEGVAKVLGVTPNLNATTADLRRGAAGSKILLISAHAVPEPAAPLFGVIYLGESDGDGGRFEVRNVYELDLNQGTELVVLSGCNTASGGGLGGGEDFGVLVRAFFGAGAPRVVASLWSVDDEASARLITRYMQERAKGTPDADALRTTMLATRQQFPEPYFWASFVLVGQP